VGRKWDAALAETCLGYLDQGFSLVCSEFNIIYVNERFNELLELPKELTTVGTSLAEIFRYNAMRGEYGDGDVEKLVEERMVLARKREAHSFERIRPDGVVLKIDGTPTSDGGFVTTYTDITELYNSRKELEKTNQELDERVQRRTEMVALREAELSEKAKALETIMESVDTGLALFDDSRNLVASNQQFIDILEYPQSFKEPGTHGNVFYEYNVKRGEYTTDEDEQHMQRNLNAARDKEPYQTIRKRHNGRYINIAAQPTDNGLLMTYTDVTEQKKAEDILRHNNEVLEERVEERTAELKAAKEMAENASQSKSQFLANMSHELRTPLNAIIGFSELLMMDDYTIMDKEKRAEYSKDINAAGAHLLQVINDILDVAKIEANQINLAETPCDLKSIINPCVQMLSVQADKQNITLKTDIPQDLPLMTGDPTRIKQIIANLLSNAVKFTDPGGCICTFVSMQENGDISVSVQDNGIGIAESDIELVQTQFGQVQSSYNRNHQGTGLGLSLVRLLTEAHNGFFNLSSALGEGTTATVHFPAERVLQTENVLSG